MIDGSPQDVTTAGQQAFNATAASEQRGARLGFFRAVVQEPRQGTGGSRRLMKHCGGG